MVVSVSVYFDLLYEHLRTNADPWWWGNKLLQSADLPLMVLFVTAAHSYNDTHSVSDQYATIPVKIWMFPDTNQMEWNFLILRSIY